MTKERKIEILKDLLIQLSDSANILCTCEADERCEVVEEYIKALEQQPYEDEVQKVVDYLLTPKSKSTCEDKITIIMDKGTLKYSGQGYVAYKKDWFRKHFATEVKIMTGYDGYCKEQEKTKKSIPLSEVYRVIAGHSDYHGDNILAALTCIAEGKEVDTVKPLPPVTPSQSWIPVSEELPKKTGWYFITFRFANGVAVCEASYRKPENYWTGKNISKKLFDNNEVIAWQPLPKPYEEKRGNEND